MSWENILKSDMRERMELELEQLLRNQFKRYKFADWDNHPWWTPDFYRRGITVNVMFTEFPKKNQTEEEMFEAGKGHYRIDFYSRNQKFAKAKYTLEGYDVYEFNPKILDIDELQTLINALKGD